MQKPNEKTSYKVPRAEVFLRKKDHYREERRYLAFKEAKHCTYCTCLLRSYLIASCSTHSVSPWGLAGNPHHVTPGILLAIAVLTGHNASTQQCLEPNRRYNIFLPKVSSRTWLRWSTQWRMTQGWRGLREEKGSWFMTYTAVEKDQNIPSSVQCYDDSLPSPADLGAGIRNTVANLWPAEIHNINCIKPNSNTQDKCRKFYDLFLLPPQVPTTYVSKWSKIVLFQTLSNLPHPVFSFKNCHFFFRLEEDLEETWRPSNFHNYTSWPDKRRYYLQVQAFPRFPRAMRQNSRHGCLKWQKDLHWFSSWFRAKLQRWRRHLNKRFSLLCVIICQLQDSCTCSLSARPGSQPFKDIKAPLLPPKPDAFSKETRSSVGTHCDAPTPHRHHEARAERLGTAPQHDYPTVET